MLKYEAIARELREDIQQGKYTPGEQLALEKEMCQQYGFDRLYTSKDYNHGYNSILTDEQIFQLAIQKDSASQQPFFSVILTMSMHQGQSVFRFCRNVQGA